MHPGQRLPAFSGLDFFPAQAGPLLADPWATAERAVEAQLGALPSVLAAERLVRSPGSNAIMGHAIRYVHGRGWAVRVEATDDATALDLAATIRRNLAPKRSLTAADPWLQDLPMYVVHRNGYVVSLPAVVAPKGPSIAQAKHRIVYRGEDALGRGSVQITGHEGAYRLTIKPVTREDRRLFSPTTVASSTLEGLSALLDTALQKIAALR